MAISASYAVGQFRDATAEVERLRAQAAIIMQAELQALSELGFPNEGRVLDLGCGPGFVAAQLGRARPSLNLVGIDRDADVLRLAKASCMAIRADATALPFAEDTFDHAYARVALRHVVKPELALAELRRVVRRSGRIFVIEGDYGSLVTYPEPPLFSTVLPAREETFRRRGGDPHMGRRVPELLVGADLEDIRVRALTVSSAQIGAEAFASIILAPLTDDVEPDLCDETTVRAAADGLREWAQLPYAFGTFSVVIASGRR